MKKTIIAFLMIGILCSASIRILAQEQTEKEKVEQNGLHSSAALFPVDNTFNNQLLNEVLLYDIDISEVLSPVILKSLSMYSTRRPAYGRREVYFNEKLITYLEGLEDNVKYLKNTEKYIKELRIILLDTKDSFIMASVISLYGKIIRENPPAQSDRIAFSPQRLYLIDTLNALVRLSAYNDNDLKMSNVILTATPEIREIIKTDTSITRDQAFQSPFLYLVEYANSSVPSKRVKKILQDILILELQIISD